MYLSIYLSIYLSFSFLLCISLYLYLELIFLDFVTHFLSFLSFSKKIFYHFQNSFIIYHFFSLCLTFLLLFIVVKPRYIYKCYPSVCFDFLWIFQWTLSIYSIIFTMVWCGWKFCDILKNCRAFLFILIFYFMLKSFDSYRFFHSCFKYEMIIFLFLISSI